MNKLQQMMDDVALLRIYVKNLRDEGGTSYVADAIERRLLATPKKRIQKESTFNPCPICYALWRGTKSARELDPSKELVIRAFGRSSHVVFEGANFKTGNVVIAIEKANFGEEFAQWNQNQIDACMRLVTGICSHPFQVAIHWVAKEHYHEQPCQVLWQGTINPETTHG